MGTFFIGNVRALTKYSYWSGNITTSYIGLSWQTKSASSSKLMTINWTDAEASNFRLRFRVLNSDYKTISTCLLNYLGSTSYNISTVNGREYLLQAQRENFLDPRVYCKGNWKIN